MKLDRLFGILSVLLERDRVQARELAERFEVSERTIFRDIAALEGAGMPVVTFPGSGGGIGILPGYKLDKRLLSKQDMAAIGAGLAGLSSIGGSREVKDLVEKLMPENSGLLALESDVVIDFSSWDDSNFLLRRIGLLRGAIADKRCVEMAYVSPGGRSSRIVEPSKIVFKANSWYLYAFCRSRREFRLFKLSRMLDVVPTDEAFAAHPAGELPLRCATGRGPGPGQRVRLRFPARQEYLVMDMFGRENYTLLPNGGLEAQFYTGDLDATLYMVLSYGPEVEVLEPQALIDRLRGWADTILGRYGEKNVQ